MNEISFGPCCFRAEQIEEQGSDPCSLTIDTARDGEWQMWFCHAACFKDRLKEHPALGAPSF